MSVVLTLLHVAKVVASHRIGYTVFKTKNKLRRGNCVVPLVCVVATQASDDTTLGLNSWRLPLSP